MFFTGENCCFSARVMVIYDYEHKLLFYSYGLELLDVFIE